MPLELAHVQPQAPEIEKAVLGALMIDRDAYMEVSNLLRVDSFYEPRNQMVYEAIVKLSADESPVDVLTVTDTLAKMGKLDEVGGPGYVADLSSRVATSANIMYHANIVAEKYLARQMIHYVGTIGNKAFDETYDIKEVIDRAIRLSDSIVIEYCTRSGKIFTCRISDIVYSSYYGGGYILAYREDVKADRTFKIGRILRVNGHAFRRIHWNQIGDDFKRIY